MIGSSGSSILPVIRPEAEDGYDEVMSPLEIKQLINACPGRFKVEVLDEPLIKAEARCHTLVTHVHLYLGLIPNRRGLPTRSRCIDVESVIRIEPLPGGEQESCEQT